jgi:hypothetical protein
MTDKSGARFQKSKWLGGRCEAEFAGVIGIVETEGEDDAGNDRRESDHGRGGGVVLPVLDIGFGTDKDCWARGQEIDARRRGGLFGEEPSGDLAETFGMVGAEVLAIAIEDAGEFGAAVVDLLPEGVGPLFFDPI